MAATFEWDPRKDRANQVRHGVSFTEAQQAFLDPRRVIAVDLSHSTKEQRYFCFEARGARVLTVRFTYREAIIRLFGAGYWRKGKRIYEQETQLHPGPDRKD